MGRLRKNPKANDILLSCKNYITNPEQYKSNWKSAVFKNNNNIEIEIGSGKGIFIITKAIQNKNTNYVAIDKYESILVKLVKKINNIENLRVISYDAKDLENIFSKGEVSKIYLNFSDPWPKSRHDKRRLTHINFLNVYKEILTSFGKIEFKTDNIDFFNWTLEHFDENNINKTYVTWDLHSENIENIMTEYEKKFSEKGTKINKVIFDFDKNY